MLALTSTLSLGFHAPATVLKQSQVSMNAGLEKLAKEQNPVLGFWDPLSARRRVCVWCICGMAMLVPLLWHGCAGARVW